MTFKSNELVRADKIPDKAPDETPAKSSDKLAAIQAERAAGIPWSRGGPDADQERLNQIIPRNAIHIRKDGVKVVRVIYYISDSNTGMIKIGVTTDVTRKLRLLREGNPRLALEAQEDGGIDTKRRRHEQFKAYRVELDWFRPEQPLLDLIMELAMAAHHGDTKAAKRRSDRSNVILAIEFLRQLLAPGQKSIEEIKHAAETLGIKWRMVEQAKHDLDIISVKEGFPGKVVGWKFK